MAQNRAFKWIRGLSQPREGLDKITVLLDSIASGGPKKLNGQLFSDSHPRQYCERGLNRLKALKSWNILKPFDMFECIYPSCSVRS
jgi:hypothetical protein